MNEFPKSVNIVEVSPRDGLQMLPKFIKTETKLSLIHELANAGFKRIEVTSFVNPKYVPQLSDSYNVLQALGNQQTFEKMVLVLNDKGLMRALDSQIEWICFVLATTESMSKRNANTNINDSIRLCKKAINEAKDRGVKLRASLAVTWVCPYEGPVKSEKVIEIIDELKEADEIALNDTVGRATPSDVYTLCKKVRETFPNISFACHFHDTNHIGLANIYAALTAGITTFDSSVGGLGGCPFSPGASGNIATEKVIWMLDKMNIYTGIDCEKLLAASALAKQIEREAA